MDLQARIYCKFRYNNLIVAKTINKMKRTMIIIAGSDNSEIEKPLDQHLKDNGM